MLNLLINGNQSKIFSCIFFCQPITCDKICSSDFSDKMNEMYTTVKDSRPKMYFVLHFENNDWNRNQTELNRYNFFKKAQQINV